MRIYFLSFVLAISIWSSALSANEFEVQKNQIDKAHENITQVKQNFKKALLKAVSEKGVQGALGDCKVMAPQLGVQAETVEIGRTSHKVRNPSNQPREWVKPLLEKYLKTPRAKHEPYQVVSLGEKHFGYVEPLYVEAVCLNCHGGHINASVKKEIAQLYPKDSATGFKVGDFRGLIWLESRSP